jgi:hypothetical protein
MIWDLLARGECAFGAGFGALNIIPQTKNRRRVIHRKSHSKLSAPLAQSRSPRQRRGYKRDKLPAQITNYKK